MVGGGSTGHTIGLTMEVAEGVLGKTEVRKLIATIDRDFNPEDYEMLCELDVHETRTDGDLQQIKVLIDSMKAPGAKEDCGICLAAPQTHVIPCAQRRFL